MARKILLTTLLIFTFSFPLQAFIGFFLADVQYKKSQQMADDRSYVAALDHANGAIAANPLEPRYRRGRAKVLLMYLVGLEGETKKQVKSLILEDLQNAYEINPENLVTIRNIIPLYYFLAADDLSLPGTDENVDQNFISIVKDFYSLIDQRYPNDVGVQLLLAKYEKRLGLTDEYNSNIDKVRELRPDLLEWYFTE